MSSLTIPSMRLIVFSTMPPIEINAFIEELKALDQQILLIVTTPGYRTRTNDIYPQIVANMRSDLDVLVTNHIDRLPTILSGLVPDLIFVASFPWRLPTALLTLPRLGCVNSHPSLLPKYRGPNPLFWQFMNGEAQTGVTIHRLNVDFDAGPILIQRSLDIEIDDDVDSLSTKLLTLGLTMLPDALLAVASSVQGRSQSNKEATYAPLCTEAEKKLDWKHSASQLYNQLRGWGHEGAFTDIDGKLFLIRRAHIVNTSLAMVSFEPGTLLQHSPEGMLIQTGQDALLITDFTCLD